MKVDEVNKLIFPLHRLENNKVKYCLHNYEMYDILEKSHKETGLYRRRRRYYTSFLYILLISVGWAPI